MYTFHFVELIKKLNISQDCYMASFDIVSLFTNVPLKETIDIILNKVYDCKLIQTKIPRKDLEILLYCCTRESSFVFNNEYYSQIDGTAMGSPLGPT
jgi:hypothetical protein